MSYVLACPPALHAHFCTCATGQMGIILVSVLVPLAGSSKGPWGNELECDALAVTARLHLPHLSSV